ncbi:MAG: thioredoxin family protein [Candidatus Heimdallarchaeota archaeon]|nr:MAG: thioredoxin family protein [Candidatus Heimdallarchaeota archaeon]
MLERITGEFYQTGDTFDEFLQSGTEDEQERFNLYYRRLEKKFSPEEFRIDLNYPVNLLVLATTWCWDSKTNVPVFIRIAEHSPNVNLKIFNKDRYPFLVDKINGGEKVPQVLIFSQDYQYLDRWVERTTLGYQLYGDVRKEYGWDESVADEFLKDYRKKYLKQQKDLEKALIQETRTLLTRIDAIQAATGRFFKK